MGNDLILCIKRQSTAVLSVAVVPKNRAEEMETEQMEQWKDIMGYEGMYQVSNYGQVKSLLRNKLLKAGTRAGLYKFVILCKNGDKKSFSVHQLVARAFLPNPDEFKEVNHKDENPANNCVDNLEWISHKENMNYSSGQKAYRKRGHARSVLQYAGTEMVAKFRSAKEASENTGISRTAINNNLMGKSKSAGGYIWKYGTD